MNGVVLLIVVCIIMILGYVYMVIKLTAKISKYRFTSRIKDEQYHMMCEWVANLHQKKNIGQWINEKKYSSIAIYGLGCVGRLLLDELKEMNIDILYIVDKNIAEQNLNTKILQPNEIEPVDCIIVTVVAEYDAIQKEIEKQVKTTVYSIEDIIYELKNS